MTMANMAAGAANTNHSKSGGSPSDAQQRYLVRGLSQPGGKLPLFDEEGQEVNRKTVRACIDHGWAEPWFINPIKSDWLVCKLTAAGYEALGADIPTKATA